MTTSYLWGITLTEAEERVAHWLVNVTSSSDINSTPYGPSDDPEFLLLRDAHESLYNKIDRRPRLCDGPHAASTACLHPDVLENYGGQPFHVARNGARAAPGLALSSFDAVRAARTAQGRGGVLAHRVPGFQ